MKDISTLTATEILAIPESEPERLFSGRLLDTIKSEHRILVKMWHPDVHQDNKDLCNSVLTRINLLFAKALEKSEAGIWIIPNIFEFRPISGEKEGHLFRIHYKKKINFELGTTYIGDEIIAYVVEDRFRDLFENGQKVISQLKFADDKMKEGVLQHLPQIMPNGVQKIKDASVIVLKKDPDLVRARDLLNYLVTTTNKKVEAKHAAWMLSNLYAFVCYLEWAQLSHNAISVDNYFISVKHTGNQRHLGAMLGGWWYSIPIGEKLKAVPAYTTRLFSNRLLEMPANFRVDLDSIKAVGRELVGNFIDNNIPSPLTKWLVLPSSGSALTDYDAWPKCLEQSFGPRKYHMLDIEVNSIYP